MSVFRVNSDSRTKHFAATVIYSNRMYSMSGFEGYFLKRKTKKMKGAKKDNRRSLRPTETVTRGRREVTIKEAALQGYGRVPRNDR
jgi:hypothetical protein